MAMEQRWLRCGRNNTTGRYQINHSIHPLENRECPLKFHSNSFRPDQQTILKDNVAVNPKCEEFESVCTSSTYVSQD